MTYKLIALDMDGTLLNPNKEISEQNRLWIARAIESGVRVTLATGRPISDASAFAQDLQLDTPLVINNGSEVWSLPDKLLARHILDSHLVSRILTEVLPAYADQVNFWSHTVEGRVNKTNLPEDVHSLRWLQLGLSSKNIGLLQEIRSELETWNAFEISNSAVTNIELNAPGINKASGLREVCGILGIQMSEVIAVGDSLNDVPMIREAGLGVAMGNAQESVKAIADVVALTNAEDGVARIIEAHI
ncbi:5-amino-6-(5-phospho-D-ribitylamino)uracil phosphatase YcsE [Paenibacillus solanacearum]|uniref:5-amino-6-(5-phospho-D-ribitylamino)uracil phosphatase YcsE n=1 Tax=Paenibacillus solanacearum TaxID=2048548 RepID=A0A916NPB3_9BACL|nr:Cof-type HAD-IIB family hydrolase [Paenibacillus solanacearum]CAG7618670.1 5-amino-6-(5-phospho-D-ribitylamino)uracil phosphatase YcsE [Paenibacillus solanacearum]